MEACLQCRSLACRPHASPHARSNRGRCSRPLSHTASSQALPCCCRDLLYLDVALENVVRSAAERGSGAAGAHAGAMVGPLLQNLVLSVGDNEELCYCLKAWQALPRDLRRGGYPSKEDALKVGLHSPGSFQPLRAVVPRLRVHGSSSGCDRLLRACSGTAGAWIYHNICVLGEQCNPLQESCSPGSLLVQDVTAAVGFGGCLVLPCGLQWDL